MNDSIRTLVDYLTKNNYDEAISPKILTRPTSKDFNNIVTFLFKQIDSNYSYSGKFEDEMITMFKHLHYPYPISKTGLVAVGSPHTWPALLATLVWLIELLGYDEEVRSTIHQEIDVELEDPSASDKTFYSYLHNAYGCFLGGDDETFAQLEEQFIEAYEIRNEQIQSQIQQYQSMNTTMEEESKSLEDRLTYLPQLRERKRDYDRDLNKFEQLIAQLDKHKELLQSKVTARSTDLETLHASTIALETEISELSRTIAHQELSLEDINRMTEEQRRLEAELAALCETKPMVQKRVWDAENSLRDRVTALEEAAARYTALAEDLMLLPENAKNAPPETDLRIEINIRAKKKTDLLRTDVQGSLLPVLDSVRQQFADQCVGLRHHVQDAQDEVEEVLQKLADLEELRVQQLARTRRAEEAYASEKATLEMSSMAQSQALDEMHARLTRLMDTGAEEARVVSAARRIAETQALLEAAKLDHARNKRLISTAVMEALSACAEHRETVQRRLGEVRETFSQRLESLLVGQGLGAGYTPLEGESRSGDDKDAHLGSTPLEEASPQFQSPIQRAVAATGNKSPSPGMSASKPLLPPSPPANAKVAETPTGRHVTLRRGTAPIFDDLDRVTVPDSDNGSVAVV